MTAVSWVHTGLCYSWSNCTGIAGSGSIKQMRICKQNTREEHWTSVVRKKTHSFLNTIKCANFPPVWSDFALCFIFWSELVMLRAHFQLAMFVLALLMFVDMPGSCLLEVHHFNGQLWSLSHCSMLKWNTACLEAKAYCFVFQVSKYTVGVEE